MIILRKKYSVDFTGHFKVLYEILLIQFEINIFFFILLWSFRNSHKSTPKKRIKTLAPIFFYISIPL